MYFFIMKDNYMKNENLFIQNQKNITKDAKFFRKLIDNEIKKNKKEEEKLKKQENIVKNKEIKSNINNLMSLIKDKCREKKSLQDLIRELQKEEISRSILDFINSISYQINKIKKNNTEGTLLITKNISFIPNILSSSVLLNRKNPKILIITEKLKNILNSNVNDDIKNKAIYYRMINNTIFNLVRDLILELIKDDMFEKNGVYNDSECN